MTTADWIALGVIVLCGADRASARVRRRRALARGDRRRRGIGARLAPELLGGERVAATRRSSRSAARSCWPRSFRASAAIAGSCAAQALSCVPPLRALDTPAGSCSAPRRACALLGRSARSLLYVPGQTRAAPRGAGVARSSASSTSAAARAADGCARARRPVRRDRRARRERRRRPTRRSLGDPASARRGASVVRVHRQRVRSRHRGLRLGRRRRGSSSRTRTSSPGSTDARVDRGDGEYRDRVVAFDPRNDVAVLRVPGLGVPPLPLADPSAAPRSRCSATRRTARSPPRPARSAGRRRRSPATRTGASRSARKVTSDARRRPARQLRRPGRRRAGRVQTTIFAAATARRGGYGVPSELVREALDGAPAGRASSTGACVALARARRATPSGCRNGATT